MSAELVVGLAAVLVAVIVITALAVLLWTARVDVANAEHAAECHRDRALELERELAQSQGELEGARRWAARLERELDEHLAELSALQAGPLVGRLVAVNTPNPDDQSIRGVCTRELEDGGLVLSPAVYMDTVRTRGGELQVQERPMAAAVIPRYAWAQIIDADGEGGELVEGNAGTDDPPPNREET